MTHSERIRLSIVVSIGWLRRKIIHIACRLLFRSKNKYERILINREGMFGDIIVALPAINLVRQHYPTARIDLFSVNNGGISFRDIPIQDDMLDNRYVVSKSERTDMLKELANNHYDLFIQIPQNLGIYKSIRNMLITRYLLGITSAFGWDEGRIKFDMEIQKKLREPMNETQRFIKTLHKHHIKGDILYPLIEEHTTLFPKQQKNIIAFLIGGKLQPKKWPTENWIKLGEKLNEQYTILVIGSSNEHAEAELISKQNNNCFNLAGKLNLSELFYVLKRIYFAISLDTGAMHLCDAAGTPQIVLFSTRDLTNKWYPTHSQSIVIENVLSCSFCLKILCEDNICMKQITPDQVIAHSRKLDQAINESTARQTSS